MLGNIIEWLKRRPGITALLVAVLVVLGAYLLPLWLSGGTDEPIPDLTAEVTPFPTEEVFASPTPEPSPSITDPVVAPTETYISDVPDSSETDGVIPNAGLTRDGAMLTVLGFLLVALGVPLIRRSA